MNSNRLELWFAHQNLGFRFVIPLIWGTVGCIAVGILAKNQNAQVKPQADAAHASLTLLEFRLLVDDVRDGLVNRDGLPRTKQQIESFAPRLGHLPEMISNRSDLQALAVNLGEIVDSIQKQETSPSLGRDQISKLVSIINHAIVRANDESAAVLKSTKKVAEHVYFGLLFAAATTIGAVILAVRYAYRQDLRLRRVRKLSLKLWGKRKRSGQAANRIPSLLKARNPAESVESVSSIALESSILKRVTEGDELTQEFLQKLCEQVSSMRNASLREDYATIGSIAGWLSGAAGTLGFDQFTAPSVNLEQMIAKESYEDILEIIDKIEQLLDAVAPKVNA